MSENPKHFAAILGAFSNRNYAIYVSGNSLSLIGLWVQRLAVGWLAWDLTQSAFWLGAVAFADLFPVIFIGPFAGVLADRSDRVKIILIGQILSALQSLSLCILVAGDWINIGLLFGLSLFQGILIGVQQPARLSLTPKLVRRENLTAAVALNSVIFNTARFVGPAVAGVLISTWGVAEAFAANAASYITMIIALNLLKLPPHEAKPPRQTSMLAEIAEGVRYTARHKVIGPLMGLMIVTVILARPVAELLPGFADAVFQRGAQGLAIMTSAIGVGAIIGGVWLAQRGTAAGLAVLSVAGAGLTGFLLPFFAGTDNFWIAVFCMGLFGLVISISGSGVQTVLQISVAEHMRGRVLSIWGLIFRGGPAIGSLIIGGLSDVYGLRWPLSIAGILCVIVAIYAYVRHRHALHSVSNPP